MKRASLGRLIDVNHIGEMTALGAHVAQLEDGSTAETLVNVEVVVERRGWPVVGVDRKYVYDTRSGNRLVQRGKNGLIIDDHKAVHRRKGDRSGPRRIVLHAGRSPVGREPEIEEVG